MASELELLRDRDGAVLTKLRHHVVALYHHMEEQSHAAIQKGFREFQTLLRRTGAGIQAKGEIVRDSTAARPRCAVPVRLEPSNPFRSGRVGRDLLLAFVLR